MHRKPAHQNDPCGCRGGCGGGRLSRRDVVKLAGLGAAAALAPDLPLMAGPFVDADFARLIPADKKLRPEWLKSLFDRGEPETYSGGDLRFIGMPVGGLFCGTLYLGGDGRLWLWDIFNRNQLGIVSRTVSYRGAELNAMGGAAYVDPLLAARQRVVEQGFALAVKTSTATLVRRLDSDGFKDVRFTGQYPVGTIQYADASVPLRVTCEAFSPFIPLNMDDSSLPVTIFSFRLENTSTESVEVELTGTLENAVCRSQPWWPGTRCNEVIAGNGLTTVQASAKPAAEPATRRPEITFEEWPTDTYEGWTAEGEAFGQGPMLKTAMPPYQGDVGGPTRRIVNSHATAPGGSVEEKDNRTGRLTSRPFTISRRFVNFWIGGGAHEGHTCLNLRMDGKVVRTATGSNDNRMHETSFEVHDYEGKQAVLEILDDAKGSWGNIGVGRITFSDAPAGAAAPTEQPDFGTMCLALLGPAAQINSGAQEAPLEQKLVGSLGRRLTLQPGRPGEIVFLIAWHFPNVGILPNARRHYTARFDDAAAVARYVAEHFDRLAPPTRLWRDTWYDSTLPYWFLNRTFANTTTLATTTCHRFKDGRFWAWEGIGCCAGTCTHVWHYAQALARLFPEIERDQRERVDFGLALAEDGTIRFRAEHGAVFAADGQAGRILGAYREHQMSRDDAFLKRLWPKVKPALERLIKADPKRNGLLLGPLHNTLDADWFGTVPWLCGLYHAALRAGEEMATETGDTNTAGACRAILKQAAPNLDAACWRDPYGYYVHQGDDAHPSEVGAYDGCHIDQVFGQHWAWQVGLGPVMTPAHVKAALKSLWTYNFTPDVGPFRAEKKAGRWYALAGDGGLIMVTFPFGPGRDFTGQGAWSAMYFNECMSGFEHQAAAHMVWEGMTLEGFAVTRAIHDRYHPRLRNPYNEVECSDHYARAMASYGTFLAACGFEYHGPKGRLGFTPRITPERFKAAFTAAEGWGTFTQTREADLQRESIELKWGRLRVRSLVFTPAGGGAPQNAEVSLAGRPLAASHTAGADKVIVTLDADAVVEAGQRLDVSLRFPAR